MQLLTLREVLARTGLARRTLFRYRENNTFPQPVKLAASSRHIAWRSTEIDAWLLERGMNRRVHRDP